MKKSRIILIASLALIISTCVMSCKKKDTAASSSNSTTLTPNQTSIIGSWSWTEGYESSNINTQGNSFVVSNTVTLTFASNNTYTSNKDFTRIGIPGLTVSDNNDSGTYSNPDSLIISSNNSGKTIKAKILKLTSNELWFRYKVYWGDYYECHFVK
jgi:hypothetical protein